jgi:hypothetical protein
MAEPVYPATPTRALTRPTNRAVLSNLGNAAKSGYGRGAPEGYAAEHFSAAFACFSDGIGRVYRDNEAEWAHFDRKRGKTGGKTRPLIRYRASGSALDAFTARFTPYAP